MSGSFGWVSTPVAPTTKRAVTESPAEVSSRQRCDSSSNVAPTTRVFSRVRRRTSYLSMQCSA